LIVTPVPYALNRYGIRAKRIPTNGIELNVFEAGSGPLVLLLHGFPECWAAWGPQIRHLLDGGYRVVAPEMRGYGESDAPEGVETYDTVELAADVAGLIDAYGEEPAVVIGHDWGCIVAWHTAWLHPEKLAVITGAGSGIGRAARHPGFIDVFRGTDTVRHQDSAAVSQGTSRLLMI
jgi:pimeloyl-ACP methyl ester carboxylesterase